MLRATWGAGSLRLWVAVGMAMAILPLALSAVVGYVILDRDVMAPFHDVATRQRTHIDPTQRLQLRLWESAVPLDLYLDSGDPRDRESFRAARQRVETGFAELHAALASEPKVRPMVERAHADWSEADRVATELISVRRPAGDPQGLELAERVDGLVASAVDKLGTAYEAIEADLKRDHDMALLAYRRSEWIVGIAAVVSVLFVIAGILIIGRLMLVSIDRLVDGAARFAAGDRDHRIEVHVPPELRAVAVEFNRMIARIRDSENELADQARRDGITGLLNRRAFNEALPDAVARMKRFGEEVILLTLDLDHFKSNNDTYGHAAGDAVLRAVSRVMVASLRETDKPFRVGGEEFAVLLQGAGAIAATATAERLRMAIAERPVAADGREITVTASIGIAIARDVREAEGLEKAADAALYRAKAEGRNRVVMGGNVGEAAVAMRSRA